MPKIEPTLKEKLAAIRRKEEERAAESLAKKSNLPYLDLTFKPVDLEAVALIPEKTAKNGMMAIIQKKGRTLIVVLGDPQNSSSQSTIKELTKQGFQIKSYLVSLSSLKKVWENYKKIKPLQKKLAGTVDISQQKLDFYQKEIDNIFDLKKILESVAKNKVLPRLPWPSATAGRPTGGLGVKITDVLEVILAAAIKTNASDAHFELEEENSRLRFRIDGMLQDVDFLELRIHHSLLSRIKLLSNLKLNVHDRAQDGRFSIIAGKNEIEIRTSVIPSEYGESMVLRVLNPQALISVEDLGLRPDLKILIEREIQKPNGMVLVTGPTGSGKTTTLYAFLKKLYSPEIKIITIEDPIEYHLEGIDQTQVKPEKGYNFASALRSILRQDPDVILVGEIRDQETAQTAMNASLTGHLVFSTLHTNEAVGAVPRLIDLGLNPNLIGPAMNIVIAQRLVRKLCENCAEKFKPAAETLVKIKSILANVPKELKPLVRPSAYPLSRTARADGVGPKIENPTFLKAASCKECHGTGFRGRLGVFEVFVVDKEVEKFLLSYPPTAELRQMAIKKGMITMQQDGLLRVIQGVTTIEEIEKVTGKI